MSIFSLKLFKLKTLKSIRKNIYYFCITVNLFLIYDILINQHKDN